MSCVYLAKELSIVVKWQSMYGFHKVPVPLPGRCVSAGTLVRNYGAENMAPSQENLSSRRREYPISEHTNGLGKKIN
jgi:hypothetical protein